MSLGCARAQSPSLVQHVSLNSVQNSEHCIRCWSTDASVCKMDYRGPDSAFELTIKFYFTSISGEEGRAEQ